MALDYPHLYKYYKDKKIKILLFADNAGEKMFQFFKIFSGNLVLPQESGGYFFLYAFRNEVGEYEFVDGLDPIALNFTQLTMMPDTMTYYCLVAKYDPSAATLKLYESDCNVDDGTVCRMWKIDAPNCTAGTNSFVQRVRFFLFNTNFQNV